MKLHKYEAKVNWVGNTGSGTSSYKEYRRDFTVSIAGKYSELLGSSDPAFMGDTSRYNPEDLFLTSIASCHMLWYLHLCASQNIIVLSYNDQCTAEMEEDDEGRGKFKRVLLNPIVTITDEAMIARAKALHLEANTMCFIANSCNFSIKHQPTIVIDP